MGFGCEAWPGLAPWLGGALGLAAAAGLWRLPQRLGPLAGVVLAVAAAQVHWQRPPPALLPDPFRDGRPVDLTGRVAEPARRTRDGLRLELDAVRVEGAALGPKNRRAVAEPPPDFAARELVGRVVLSVPDRQRTAELVLGARVRTAVALRRVLPTPNPGVSDPAEVMLNRRITARGTARSVVVETPATSWIDALRDRFRDAVASATPEAATLLEAMMLGDQGTLDPERQDRWRRAGITHILSISGLHVAVVAIAAELAVRFAFAAWPWWSTRRSARRPAAIVAMFAGWLYVVVAGAPLAAVRSALMVSALFAARAIGRTTGGGSVLALAALVTLLRDPWAVKDPSFQLSYAAVAGLILGAPQPTSPAPTRLRAALRGLGLALMTSAVCTLATLPILLVHFGAVSVAGLVTNLVAVPLSSLAVVIPGFIALIGATLGLNTPVLWVSDLLVPWLEAIARWGAVVPELRHAGVSWFELVLTTICAVLCLLRRSRSQVVVGLVCGVVGVVGLPRGRSAGLEAVFLAVGHGDAVLLRLPSGHDLLVDGGGDPLGKRDIGGTIVVPALESLGVEALDAVVLTHPHPDHFRGLRPVFERFPVRELWWNGETSRDPEFTAMLEAADRQGTIRRRPNGAIELGEVVLETLHPVDGAGAVVPHEALEQNDNSIVLRVRYRDFSLLLTGDIEGPAEELLVATTDLKATVLKVPHHGSRTSSSEAFLDAVRPLYAVCGSADHGRFPFPHDEIAQRYADRGIPLWITGRSGAARLWTDGARWEVTSAR